MIATRHFVLLAIILAQAAFSQESQMPDIVTLSPEEINADPALINGRRYVSSGVPDNATLNILDENDFVAVIDLRAPNETSGSGEPIEVATRGMKYFSIPVSGPEDMTYDKARELDQVLQSLDGPVLLHCASGNRVGALFALRAKQNGASIEEAINIGRKAGLTRSEAFISQRLAEE